MTSRRFRSPFLCAALVLFASAAGAEGVLEIVTDPPGFDAWANDRYLGRTPIAAGVDQGTILVRLAERSDSLLWSAPAVDTLLQSVDGETLRLALRIGRGFSIRSRPIGLPVMRGGRKLGETPLDLRLVPEDLGRLRLETPEGGVRVPPESLLARGAWTWAGPLRAIDRSPKEGGSLLRWLGRYGTPILACGLAIGATNAENAADRSYGKYLSASDPGRIERHYEEARDRDALSTALWIGAEVSIATMIIAWIFPEEDDNGSTAGAGGGR